MPTFDYLFWDGNCLMGHTVGEDIVLATMDDGVCDGDAAEFRSWTMKHAFASGLTKEQYERVQQ